MSRKPSSDCGPLCAALSEREHIFHLLHLAEPGKPHAQVYRATCERMGASTPAPDSCHSSGSRMIHSDKVQAALGFHRDAEAVRYAQTKQRSVERLAALAEHASMGHFANVETRPQVVEIDGEETVVEAEDVVLVPWEEHTIDKLRAVGSIEKKRDGSIKITVRDPVAAERALMDAGGWKAPARVDVSSVDQKWSELYAAVGDGDEAAQAAVLDADASDDASIIAAWRAWKEA